MNRKQWTLSYRMYRICCQQAESFNWEQPEFFLHYPVGKFHQIRHQNIVLNSKSGFTFSVKTWPGKCVRPATKPAPLIDWMGDADALYSRWVGWYVLIATAFFPDAETITYGTITPRQWGYLEKLEKEKA